MPDKFTKEGYGKKEIAVTEKVKQYLINRPVTQKKEAKKKASN